ncbi:MAG: metal-dependent phosphohydrolase, partial [Pseudomonadota bacterium]
MSDLAHGEPLRWDVFGAAAAPLLRQGELVADAHQLEAWLADGLYAEAGPPSCSVLHSLNELGKRLERLLRGLRTDTAAEQTGMLLAHELVATVERAPDIALAAIFLNQIAGLYLVRHCIETAIVVVLVGRAHGCG